MEDNLRATLEMQRDQYRAKLARVERWIAELDEEQPEVGETATPGDSNVSRQQRGELKEHHVVDKSVLDASKEVLRSVGKSMSSNEITQALIKVGYNFGARQPVKSVGKALRMASNKPGAEIIYNSVTENYSLRVG